MILRAFVSLIVILTDSQSIFYRRVYVNPEVFYEMEVRTITRMRTITTATETWALCLCLNLNFLYCVYLSLAIFPSFLLHLLVLSLHRQCNLGSQYSSVLLWMTLHLNPTHFTLLYSTTRHFDVFHYSILPALYFPFLHIISLYSTSSLLFTTLTFILPLYTLVTPGVTRESNSRMRSSSQLPHWRDCKPEEWEGGADRQAERVWVVTGICQGSYRWAAGWLNVHTGGHSYPSFLSPFCSFDLTSSFHSCLLTVLPFRNFVFLLSFLPSLFSF